MPHLTALLALLVLTGVGVACGSDAPEVYSEEPPAWSHQELSTNPGADRALLVAEGHDQVTVLITTEDDVVTGWSTGPDGTFTAGDPLPIDTGDEGIVSLSALAATADGWLALGHAGPDHVMVVLRSEDGRSWRPITPSGFATPGDVADLVATEDGLVAVGSLRTGTDPSGGPFAPVAWRSSDGEAWEEIPLPRDGTEVDPYDSSYAGAVVAVGAELLATGRVGTEGALWSSSDGGATWDRVRPPGLEAAVELRDLARAGDVLVASGMVAVGPGPVDPDLGYESRAALFRSTDDGATWDQVETPGGPQREAYPAPVTAAGPGFLVLGSTSVHSWDTPGVCYADIERCRQGSRTTLHHSPDGQRWTPVDTGALGLADHQDLDQVFGGATGTVLLLGARATGVDTWAWPARTDLPEGQDDPIPEADVTVLADGDRPQPGVAYAVPLYIHCGMDWLYLGGEPWRRTDGGPDVETGAGDDPSDRWPLAGQTIFGFATLVAADRVEYSIGDGEVIATYGPAEEEPPGCA